MSKGLRAEQLRWIGFGVKPCRDPQGPATPLFILCSFLAQTLTEHPFGWVRSGTVLGAGNSKMNI